MLVVRWLLVASWLSSGVSVRGEIVAPFSIDELLAYYRDGDGPMFCLFLAKSNGVFVAHCVSCWGLVDSLLTARRVNNISPRGMSVAGRTLWRGTLRNQLTRSGELVNLAYSPKVTILLANSF